VVISLVVFLATGVPTSAAPSAPSTPAAPARADVDSATALVELTGDALTVNARTRPGRGQRVDTSSAAARNERAQLAVIRNDFRRWLRENAPAARIGSEFDLALHAVSVTLNGTSLDTLRRAPMVRNAELQQLFYPVAHDDPDLDLVNAIEAWTAAGDPNGSTAGAGVRVAVIDSGIDVNHPCFDDTTYAPQQQIGDPDLTSNKVIVARVFSNRIRQDGFDPAAVDSHGTHVAGTIACNAHTPATIEGVDIPYDPSGVAPRALLGNYNVFPGTTGFGRSEDILQALEAAYRDGMQVANMSLGGARNDGGGAFLLDNAIDNLDRANMVVVVAAGNEGPGYFTVHYPGAAPRALTVGASTVGHAIINLVTVAGAQYEAVAGDFASVETDLTAPLAIVSDPSNLETGLSTACDEGPPLPPLTGKIALLGRGTCDFTVKMRNAEDAGAVGVIMVNRIPGEAPFVMAHNGLEPQPTIPGYMVSYEDGSVIDAPTNEGDPATLHALGVYERDPADTNAMAGFSSWGPTHGDLLIKPDVVAPGADIISAFPASHCDPPPPEGCWSFLGGTSMATPHVAGAAAVVRGVHPDWSAAEVRSAVVNTAQENVLRHPITDVVTTDAQIVGAGLLDVGAATGAVAALDPVSQSFRSVSAGSGGRRSATTTVMNIDDVARTYTVALADDASDGVLFSTSATSFTLQPGTSRSITIDAVATRRITEGPRQATLRVSSGGFEVAHSVVYVLIGSGDRAPGQHMAPPPFA
jgi:subtilisin family serine protease